MQSVRFIVLIPHRDSGRLLWAYRGELFRAGLVGAYSFPPVAPLAVVSQPFTREELKALAHEVRELSIQKGEDGQKGKISSGELAFLTYSVFSPPQQELTLFGPLLDLPRPEFAQNTVQKQLYRFPVVLLAAGLIPAGERELLRQDGFPQAPTVSFRAGMVANMVFRPLLSGAAGYSFTWKIGDPLWLPAYRNRKADRS